MKGTDKVIFIFNEYLVSASFQWLLHATLPTEVRHGKSKEPTIGRMLYCIVINGLLCTPVMMIQMSFFQLISGDLQGNLEQTFKT